MSRMCYININFVIQKIVFKLSNFKILIFYVPYVSSFF